MKICRFYQFTLVELLVVVAIIIILMSMLLPALRRAKEYGRRAVCKSNQRQLYAAYNSYSNDFDDRLPAWQSIRDHWSQATVNWQATNAGIRYFMNEYAATPVDMAFNKFPSRTDTISHCPSAMVYGINQPFRLEHTSYVYTGIGAYIHYDDPQYNFGTTRMTKIGTGFHDGKVVFMYDVTGGKVTTSQGTYHQAALRNHNDRGANLTYADGEIVWINANQMTYGQANLPLVDGYLQRCHNLWDSAAGKFSLIVNGSAIAYSNDAARNLRHAFGYYR